MNEIMKARVIAYYLPQFHPIPENDKFWGKGFTEWTNVAKARPLFKGHHQPNIPADLGFYDLRMPEIREEQARLAKEAGIEGFCYWHYWFGEGKELLERPFNEVVETGNPDFPFCLGWANHSWSTKTWTNTKTGFEQNIIAEQKYLGEKDHILHFYKYLKAFRDKRYIAVDGKLLFVIFSPLAFEGFSEFKECWNRLAKENGLQGFHFVGIARNYAATNAKTNSKIPSNKDIDAVAKDYYQEILNLGYDAVQSRGDVRACLLSSSFVSYYFKRFLQKIGIKYIVKFQYADIIKHYFAKEDAWENVYPTIIPNFDRSPRAGWNTNNLWYGSTPELFKKHVEMALDLVKCKKEEHKILFLQSWNEWGEGNYMEPDIQFGHGYIKALRDTLN